MEKSLALLIFSALVFQVNCYCNPEECKRKVDTILSQADYCSDQANKNAAVNALMECIKDGEENACPREVREQMPPKAQEVYDKNTQECGQQEARTTCRAEEAFLCIAGLGEFINARKFSSITDIQAGCDLVKPMLEVVDICKSCIGSFFGAEWEAVRVDVEYVWEGVSDLLGGACDCAAEIKETIDNVRTGATCRIIEWAQERAETLAQQCIVDLVESFQTYDWLTLTYKYIETIGIYTKNSCFFAGQDSAGVAIALSSTLGAIVFFAYFLVLTRL